MIINNTWNENILTTKACDIIKTPSETVVKSHTNKDYGKMLGIEYTKFETNNDIIRCTFQQKFAFKTFDMNFVKKITRHEDRVDITFQTVNSLVEMVRDTNVIWLLHNVESKYGRSWMGALCSRSGTSDFWKG